jgi:hypothetical protein
VFRVYGSAASKATNLIKKKRRFSRIQEYAKIKVSIMITMRTAVAVAAVTATTTNNKMRRKKEEQTNKEI